MGHNTKGSSCKVSFTLSNIGFMPAVGLSINARKVVGIINACFNPAVEPRRLLDDLQRASSNYLLISNLSFQPCHQGWRLLTFFASLNAAVKQPHGVGIGNLSFRCPPQGIHRELVSTARPQGGFTPQFGYGWRRSFSVSGDLLQARVYGAWTPPCLYSI